jgi:primosomal protein N''
MLPGPFTIDQALLSKVFEDVSTPPDGRWARLGTHSSYALSRLLTTESLKVCAKTMDDSSSWLKGHLLNLDNRLASLLAQSPQISSEQAAEQERIQDEIDSIKQCLAICAEASVRGPN